MTEQTDAAHVMGGKIVALHTIFASLPQPIQQQVWLHLLATMVIATPADKQGDMAQALLDRADLEALRVMDVAALKICLERAERIERHEKHEMRRKLVREQAGRV